MSAIPIHRTRYAARTRATSRRKALSSSTVMTYAISFVIIAFTTFTASNLAGNVLMEKARREGIRSTQRARDSRASVATLSRTVESMTSFNSLHEWAIGHGFLAPEQLPQPSVQRRYVAYDR